ncbi:hypothetical protein SUDANB135_00046 [Streptomyces sp. SudanB135_2055]
MSVLQPSTHFIRPSPEGAVRRVLEAALEQATLVDLEAAFAWVSEGRLADDLLADWRRLGEEVQAELARCQEAVRTLQDVTVPQDTLRYGRCAAELILRSDLQGLVSLTDKAVQWCDQARDDVIADFGRLIRERRTQFPSAGHPPPLIVRDDGTVEEADTGGTLIGVLPEITTRTAELWLAPGETCLLYTDGVTEAKGGPLGDTMFGQERLQRALLGCAGMPAQAVVERVQMRVDEWIGHGRHDDIAVLAITAPRGSHLSAVDGTTPGRYTA